MIQPPSLWKHDFYVFMFFGFKNHNLNVFLSWIKGNKLHSKKNIDKCPRYLTKLRTDCYDVRWGKGNSIIWYSQGPEGLIELSDSVDKLFTTLVRTVGMYGHNFGWLQPLGINTKIGDTESQPPHQLHCILGTTKIYW